MSETKAEETPLFPKKTKKKSKGPARIVTARKLALSLA